jgi:hypothetical protein
MTTFQRQLLLTVLLAGMAGFGGVWFGAHGFQADSASRAPLRMAVDKLTKRGLLGLTSAQTEKINEIQVRYARTR